ncbi:MAG TPA: cytochrome P450 [Stellaceae bacterium]|nr:cytochrome P450 [Stellaceae bacterium]
MSEATTAAPVFDPLSPAFIRDPYPFYRRLRAYDPLWRAPTGYRVASRHADIAFILRDRRFGKAYWPRMTARYGPDATAEPVLREMGLWMLHLDPPDHTRLRALVVKAFTARRVADMRPRVQAIVDAAIDRIEPDGAMDVIRDFAFRLPVTVVCDMLGIPEEDRDRFFQSARDGHGGRVVDPVPMNRAELDAANARSEGAMDYFRRLFALRRAEPGDDLTSQLVHAEEAGQKLSEEELVANISLLFGAGHETTVNLIGNGLLSLYRNPDQLRLLRERPELAVNAVEETLRYDSSVQVTGRAALQDVSVGGVAIKAGEGVLCLLGAGNRDPEIYDEPDRLDITRDNIEPLSFGGGIHYCLGAQLARLEGEIAISTLLRRLPGLTLDNPEQPEWLPTFVLRGVQKLPAHW